ncbi:hypothetical protein [Actinoplanes auranticolor]|uniref:Uncharacterized protein n=1 Tax=Actinoplanes auranticolor TaxID=47988 RepID=A0A919VTT3_9ACTN|nr:hypothetical protein [Actinoplanes auranticolor]GIM75100.1 hypothetical protein Aau02nite_64270 [Actinoplanes auranticolor]
MVAALRRGISLREMHRQFPFMRVDPVAMAREEGDRPGLWDIYLNDPYLVTLRPLLRAAHADQRLRRFYPSVDHGTVFRLVADLHDRAAGKVAVVKRMNEDLRRGWTQ